jgi:hypothetical protein
MIRVICHRHPAGHWFASFAARSWESRPGETPAESMRRLFAHAEQPVVEESCVVVHDACNADRQVFDFAPGVDAMA